MFQIPKSSSTKGQALTQTERIYLAILYYILLDERALEEIDRLATERGKPLIGYPKQSISGIPNLINNAITRKNEEVLTLLRRWGIDPAIDLDKQDLDLIREKTAADRPY